MIDVMGNKICYFLALATKVHLRRRTRPVLLSSITVIKERWMDGCGWMGVTVW